jgi:signal transduction histidine kinase/CheY-like chemotaxis protein
MKRHPDPKVDLTALSGGVAITGLLLVVLIAIGAPRSATIGLGLLLVAGAGFAFMRRSRILQAERAQFGELAEGVRALAWVVGPDGRVICANREASDFTGAVAAGGFSVRTLFDPADAGFQEALPRLLAEGRPLSLQAPLKHRDGSYRQFLFTGTPLSCSGEGKPDAFLVTASEPLTTRPQDMASVTVEPASAAHPDTAPVAVEPENREEHREALDGTASPPVDLHGAARLSSEHQLRQSQKLDALARLTGGLAHDLNNRMMVITASIDAVAKHIKDRPDLRRRLVAALVAADQANALISKLLAFARQHDAQAKYVDTAEQLRSIATLLERSFPGHSVELILHVDEDLWPVNADPDRLETAIVNLAVNAREAMKDGGSVHLHAYNTVVGRGSLSEPELSGEFIEIRVSENAARVPAPVPAILSSEPGMSQVQDFAKQHGGIVEITPREGEGTSVSLFLPRSELPARVGVRPRAEDLVDDEEETEPAAEVLVVDDEEEVALAMQALLERAGYATRVAIGADRAIESIAAQRPGVVLTDVTMSGKMDGIALAHLIREGDPTLPVVLITGNPMVLAGECPFPVLNKPISSRDLHAAIQRYLQPQEGEKVVPFLRKPAQ